MHISKKISHIYTYSEECKSSLDSRDEYSTGPPM